VDSLKQLLPAEVYEEYHSQCDSFLRETLFIIKNPLKCGQLIEDFLQYTGVKRFRVPRFREFLPKFIDDCALPSKSLYAFVN